MSLKTPKILRKFSEHLQPQMPELQFLKSLIFPRALWKLQIWVKFSIYSYLKCFSFKGLIRTIVRTIVRESMRTTSGKIDTTSGQTNTMTSTASRRKSTTGTTRNQINTTSGQRSTMIGKTSTTGATKGQTVLRIARQVLWVLQVK